MRILMVCLGNICRSPIAEGVLRHMAQQRGLNWKIDSAGTNNYHTGEAPHKHSQSVCKAHGIDISTQRARLFSAADLDKYDLIYAMATDVLEDIRYHARQKIDPAKVKLFLDEIEPGKRSSVPDPWYGNEDGYLPVYQLIEKTCAAIIDKYAY